MKPLPPIELTPSSDRQQLQIALDGEYWQAKRKTSPDTEQLLEWEGPPLDTTASQRVLDALFHELDAPRIELTGSAREAFDTRHPAWEHHADSTSIERAAFYQIREHWLDPALWPVMPETTVQTDDVCHPRRPSVGDQILYRRFAPSAGRTITLRQATVTHDGERFHRWQNEPRAARFWEYPWSRERLDAMLEDRRADPHSLPLILEADGEAVGYFETYYVPEDRLGPYCEARPFDQGMHVLIGERQFLGEGQTNLWLNTVSHFLFLMEPRTRSLWGEPRSDNRAMLRYLRSTTWENHGEFDFPHKRSALLCNPRRRFFADTRL
ncbi:GNAT family N-acetyltransferase [Marinobacter sp. OP 3.4]|uniref:GNAT family N-acetyltransferase n=1 Tax=Marinobacter sp. OP 3.4 TaxID=3076501 RepID=UPI002E215388